MRGVLHAEHLACRVVGIGQVLQDRARLTGAVGKEPLQTLVGRVVGPRAAHPIAGLFSLDLATSAVATFLHQDALQTVVEEDGQRSRQAIDTITRLLLVACCIRLRDQLPQRPVLPVSGVALCVDSDMGQRCEHRCLCQILHKPACLNGAVCAQVVALEQHRAGRIVMSSQTSAAVEQSLTAVGAGITEALRTPAGRLARLLFVDGCQAQQGVIFMGVACLCGVPRVQNLIGRASPSDAAPAVDVVTLHHPSAQGVAGALIGGCGGFGFSQCAQARVPLLM